MYLVPDIQLQSRLIKWSIYLIIGVMIIAIPVLTGWQLTCVFTESITAHFLIPATIIVPAVLRLARLYDNKAGCYPQGISMTIFSMQVLVEKIIVKPGRKISQMAPFDKGTVFYFTV
jgi:hypothetical protein